MVEADIWFEYRRSIESWLMESDWLMIRCWSVESGWSMIGCWLVENDGRWWYIVWLVPTMCDWFLLRVNAQYGDRNKTQTDVNNPTDSVTKPQRGANVIPTIVG